MNRLLALFCLSLCPLFADIPIRVGLDTQATEWIVSLDGGGELRSRAGRPLLTVKDGERIRIWWDTQGAVNPTDEYRVQVGGPLPLKDAETLLANLRRLGESPDRVRVSDGETWRILAGHFETTDDAEPLLSKLRKEGHEELWISSESRPGKPKQGRALYAITERYERRALPTDGVSFAPRGVLTQIHGKGRYRGRVDIFPNARGRLTVVNTLDLETYLRGVVPKEMGVWEFPAIEALKAQAVAARTYAVANRGKRSAEGFDLLDTVADQVYGGRDGEANLSDRAVEETKGLVATYGGKPIQALFMANSGGSTVDNTYVFGGGATPYLKAASNYVERPTCLKFKGVSAPQGDQDWLTVDILRLAAVGAVPLDWLDPTRLSKPLQPQDLRAALLPITRRLAFQDPPPCTEKGAGMLLWAARALHLDEAAARQERPQDGAYFLGDLAGWKSSDLPLAAFLARRAIVAPSQWKSSSLTLARGLQVLGRLWTELETPALQEGTLLQDGQVRVKGSGPEPLKLHGELLIAEEAPGGHLRIVAESAVQVGDRVRWMPAEGGSRLLIRRLDPDGASLDRYNPTAHWKVELKERDLMPRLKDRAGIASFRHFELTRDAHGRVLELVVRDQAGGSHRFKGMRIRGLLGLKDNVFSMIQTGSAPNRTWIIHGRGWGHGVGMDQTGAYGYALEGWTFAQILKHYYQGIELKPVE